MNKKYTFDDHKHNFAVWTAARAVQRGFTSTQNIKGAIECSYLRKYAENTHEFDSISFDEFHVLCSKQIIEKLETLTNKPVYYGQAAKNIAIYLKTSVILPNKTR